MFVEWRLVIENVVKEARPYHLGVTSDGFLATLWWYLDGTLLASLGAVGLLLAALGAFSLPAVDAVLWTRAVAQPDTRTLAYDWLLENVWADSRVLVEAYSPQLPADRFRLYVVSQGYIDPLDGGPRTYPVPTGIIGTLRSPSLVRQAGIDYVILADHYDRRLAKPRRYARQIAVYEELMSTSEILYQAEPARGHAAGLTVRVYKVRR